MDDLLKKLNVIVKATVNDMLTGDSRRSKLPGHEGNPSPAGKNAETQIAQFRQRIDETLKFEDELQKQIVALHSEIDDWNEQADEAVKIGDDAAARRAVEQVQRVQERLTIAQSDLTEHERITQELIFSVNTLEAAVTSAKTEAADQPEQTTLDERVSGVLQDMRDKALELRDQLASRSESDSSIPTENPISTATVEDDLDKRRKRLTKPD